MQPVPINKAVRLKNKYLEQAKKLQDQGKTDEAAVALKKAEKWADEIQRQMKALPDAPPSKRGRRKS